MRSTTRAATVAFVLFAAVGLAGCGSDDNSDDAGSAPTSASDSTTDSGSESSDAPTVAIASTSLGDVLTDGDGMTLYLFTKDSGTTTACSGECAAAWPALVGEPTAGDGVDASLLGSAEQADGTTQATYNGHLLYYFAQDAAAGDVNGQALMDAWWVVDADGNAVEDAPSTDSGY